MKERLITDGKYQDGDKALDPKGVTHVMGTSFFSDDNWVSEGIYPDEMYTLVKHAGWTVVRQEEPPAFLVTVAVRNVNHSMIAPVNPDYYREGDSIITCPDTPDARRRLSMQIVAEGKAKIHDGPHVRFALIGGTDAETWLHVNAKPGDQVLLVRPKEGS